MSNAIPNYFEKGRVVNSIAEMSNAIPTPVRPTYFFSSCSRNEAFFMPLSRLSIRGGSRVWKLRCQSTNGHGGNQASTPFPLYRLYLCRAIKL